MSASKFYYVRSCNDDYVPIEPVNTFTSSTRDENADEPWSPRMRMQHTGRPQPPFTAELFAAVPLMYTDKFSVTRSTCEPNELEKKHFQNIDNITSQYAEANIGFRECKYTFPWVGSDFESVVRFESDSHLEAIDAKMEALYETETIMMELTLNEPEDYNRPYFDDDDAEYCSECNQEKDIASYGLRSDYDKLCFDCWALPCMDDYDEH